MEADIWKDRDVAAGFLNERTLHVPERARQFEILLRILRHLPINVSRVLDLGTGDGVVLATVLEAFPQARGWALDFSPLMLEQARSRLARFGGRVQVLEGDLQSPVWTNALSGPFDAIVSSLAIHHLTHLRKGELYAEIFALVSPGGMFLNIEHVSSPTPWIEELFNDAITDHLFERRRERAEKVTREEVRRDFLERPDREANILASVEEQCQWLRDIGFHEVDCFWKYFELAIFGGRRP
jgi:ubiquinone/menaquinone biosynthesis C-methylase UbiE